MARPAITAAVPFIEAERPWSEEARCAVAAPTSRITAEVVLASLTAAADAADEQLRLLEKAPCVTPSTAELWMLGCEQEREAAS
jgi:hypothetical protein